MGLHVYFKVQVLFYSLKKALDQRFDVFSFPHPDLLYLSCDYIVTHATFLWRRQWHPSPVLLPGRSYGQKSLVGCSPWGAKCQTWLSNFTFRFHFHSLVKEMTTHSSVLPWRIPGKGEPGGLPSLGLHRVGHDWSDLAAAACYIPQFISYLSTSCLPLAS